MAGTHSERPHRRASPRHAWRVLLTAVLASLTLIGAVMAANAVWGGPDPHAVTTAPTHHESRHPTHHVTPPTLKARTERPARSGSQRHRYLVTVARVLSGPVIKPMTAQQLAARQAAVAAREAARQAAIAAHVAAVQARQAAAKAAQIAASSFDVTVGTFNVLASQHSTPSGDHSRYPPASVRSVGAARLIGAHHVDVLGGQELKPDQLNAITRMTGMRAWPGYAFGSRNTDNSILYDPTKFEFVSGTSYPVKFMNAVRPQTVLRLRERTTGREMYFVNTHVSASDAPQYVASRRAGHYAAIAEVNRLKTQGLPVFLTGDMNDRAEFFCRVVPATGLLASDGGSVAGGCHPPGRLAVDWVLGTGGVSWSGYWQDRSPIGRISDHFFVSATAHIAGATP